MNTLIEIQSNCKFDTDKNTRHSYLSHYDKLFLSFKNKKIKLLEIGISTGVSIMLWNKYFTDCTIFCIDLDITNIKYDEIFNSNNIYVIPKNFDTITENFFGDILFDIIVDDGSHTLEHQLKSIDIFRKKLNVGGILIVEDIQESYYNHIKSYIKNINNCELLDLRHENNIEDNMLVIYKNNE